MRLFWELLHHCLYLTMISSGTMISSERLGTTPRNFFYKYEKKVPSDPRLYLKYDTAKSHIALLCDAVCLDRVSVGFLPRISGKFIGPIIITRPDAPAWRRKIDYGENGAEPGLIGPEWIQAFNLIVDVRDLSVDESTFKGIVLFEEEGTFAVFLFAKSQCTPHQTFPRIFLQLSQKVDKPWVHLHPHIRVSRFVHHLVHQICESHI